MKRTVISIIFLFTISFFIAGCSSLSPAKNESVPPATSSVKEVKIANFAFDPSALTIPVGTTVKWTNQDTADHTVTADDKSFDSGHLAQGKSFSFTFTNAGTFSYKCSIHTNMVGKIIVTK